MDLDKYRYSVFSNVTHNENDIATNVWQNMIASQVDGVLMMADKILTDIIFKDNYYLSFEDFENSLISKTETAVEERALEVIKDWYVSEKRHFFDRKEDDDIEERIELYGKKLQDGYIAFIPSILKDRLNSNGFDGDEVINAWKRKNYLKCDKNRTKTFEDFVL